MKTYVWGLPTRIFHFCLVLFIIISWMSADDDYLQIHSAFGYAIGVLIIYRFVWGIIGPKYSHFRDFNFSIKKAIDFSNNILFNEKKYLGHNPAASIVLFYMLVIILITVLSGVLTLGEQEEKGVFSSLHSTFFKDFELLEALHELFANFMLAFIFIHLMGILIDRLLHKEDETVKSILTGYKKIAGQNAKINLYQYFISIAFFILSILVIYFTFSNTGFLYS